MKTVSFGSGAADNVRDPSPGQPGGRRGTAAAAAWPQNLGGENFPPRLIHSPQASAAFPIYVLQPTPRHPTGPSASPPTVRLCLSAPLD